MGSGSSGLSGGGGSLGMNAVRNILGTKEVNDLEFSSPGFVAALSNATLKKNEDGEIAFKFYGKDKTTGRSKVLEVYSTDLQNARSDIRANGYTINRIFSSNVYDAIINHTDGERWDYAAAKKIDDALLKR